MQYGKRYYLVYRSDTQKLNRAAIMVYLGETETHYEFSARPVAGTQTMPKHWLKEEPSERDERHAVFLNKIIG